MVLKMSKKPMNNILKLTLFLAAVATLSAGTITGVHLLTKDQISYNEEVKRNSGYLEILEITSFKEALQAEVTADLKAGGVTKITSFTAADDALIGIVYDMEITGFAPGLKFQVGFKEGLYAGFVLVSSGETPTYGGELLKRVNDSIKNKNAGDPVVINEEGITVGVTTTRVPLVEALELVASDYLGRSAA